MARHHLDELRDSLLESGWSVQAVHPGTSRHVCGLWELGHASGARRHLEFTSGVPGSQRFEDSSGCHLENDKSRYVYFSAVSSQWERDLKRWLEVTNI